MAKITRIKPKEEGYIRIELDFSHSDFIRTHYFKPRALTIPNEGADVDVMFEVDAGSRTEIGKYGINLPILDDSKEKIVTIYQFGQDVPEEQLLAQCVQLQKNLTTIEEQVKAALEELKAAESEIKEV